MDKRYKWNVSQTRGGYLEPQAYGQHMPRSAYQPPFKNNARLNHSYSYGKHNASGPGKNNYYKPPPPPQQPSHVRDSGGGGWMAQAAESESVQKNSSDVVTLIVENNNLKRMILLHMNLMQEQTDQLKGKDNELDEQNGRIKTLLSQNQELMQQIAKLSQRVEDLRNQLRRCVKRSANDDDDQQPKAKIQCYLEKQTQTLDLLQMEEEEPVIHRYTHEEPQNALLTSITDLPPTTPVASTLDSSKGRGEFNGGKKVSTIFLHRVHQEKSGYQLQDDEQQQEEEEQNMEDNEEVHKEAVAETEELVTQTEEVVVEEEHIYLDTHEMEVATETEVGGEVELTVEEMVEDVDAINNGHIYEEEVVEQEIVNNCEASNPWQPEMTREAEDEEDKAPEEEDDPEEEDEVESDHEAESEDEAESDHEVEAEPEEEEVAEESQHQVIVNEEDEAIAEDTSVAHQRPSTPHPKQRELKEKQQESQITQEEEEPPSSDLQTEQLNNKLELEDQEQQQKLIEMEVQQLIMKDDADINQLEVQSADKLPEVQEDKVPKELTQSRPIETTSSLKSNAATKSNHQAANQRIEGTVVKSKKQSARTHKSSEKETQATTEDAESEWRPSNEKFMDMVQEPWPSPENDEESLFDRKERKKKELKEQKQKLKTLLRQKEERRQQRKDELKREKELQREQEMQREKELQREKDLQQEQEREKKWARESLARVQRAEEAQKELERQREREREQEQRKREQEKELAKQQKQTEADIEEEAMRKLQEHIQKQQQRLQQQSQQQNQQQNPTVRIKKQSLHSTSLIFPPIQSASAATITPAPSPTNAASPKLKPSNNSSNNNNNNSTTTIQTPLTPQSISSVSSNSNSNNSNNKRIVVLNSLNSTPHTYSKLSNSSSSSSGGKNSKSSGRSTSRFVTSAQPYTTRSWEDQEFHCDNEFFLEEADELLADNPSLEIPKWKVVRLQRIEDDTNIEQLSDAAFEDRHEKYVRDEKERKRRDERVIREQIRINDLRSRHNQDEVLVALDPLPTSTFYPLPEDIEGIQFVTEVPVQAFGENMVYLPAQNEYFTLPWLDAATATTAIAKAKADAVPVATLDSKKLPTTHAEAKHLQQNSSYVFLKLRKRQRRR